jgi:hypothetical protein
MVQRHIRLVAGSKHKNETGLTFRHSRLQRWMNPQYSSGLAAHANGLAQGLAQSTAAPASGQRITEPSPRAAE